MDLSSLLSVAAAMNNIEGEPSWETVVITGLVLVFCVLVLLYLLITLEGVIFSSIENKKKAALAEKAAPAPAAPTAIAPQQAAKAPVIEKGIPGEAVAAITAALACMDGGSGYTLRSLKRAKTGRSAWSQAGVVSYTEPF